MQTEQGPAPTFQDVWRMFEETNRRFQDTDRKIQETDRIVKNLSKNIGALGNRLGEFVEHMVAPAVVRLFQGEGLGVHEVHQGVTSSRGGEGIEIDLLVVNDGVLVAVECKSKLAFEHVDEHLERMEKLKRLLPTYGHYRALGAVAAIVATDEVREYALNRGLYVLYQNGENVEIGNRTDFVAREW